MSKLASRMKGLGPDDLLWTGRDSGFMRILGHNSFFHNALRRIRDRDPDFPWPTPHRLRHVAAGLMVSAGANVKVVQRQLGHATAARLLDRYADLFNDHPDGIADTLDGVKGHFLRDVLLTRQYLPPKEKWDIL